MFIRSHNRALFTKLWLLKNLKKMLKIFAIWQSTLEVNSSILMVRILPNGCFIISCLFFYFFRAECHIIIKLLNKLACLSHTEEYWSSVCFVLTSLHLIPNIGSVKGCNYYKIIFFIFFWIISYSASAKTYWLEMPGNCLWKELFLVY